MQNRDGYGWGFKQVTDRKLNAKSSVNAADEQQHLLALA
jgi:hypothetical protein